MTRRPPEVALVRSLLVTITGIAAWWLGREVSTEWVDNVTTLYALAAPFIAGALIRQGVTPVKAPKHRRQE